MNNNPGRQVTLFKIATIFGEDYLEAAVRLNAINELVKISIYFINLDVFIEVDFIATATTEVEFNADLDASQKVSFGGDNR